MEAKNAPPQLVSIQPGFLEDKSKLHRSMGQDQVRYDGIVGESRKKFTLSSCSAHLLRLSIFHCCLHDFSRNPI